MPVFFLRYFSIVVVTAGFLVVANTVLSANDPSTKELTESTRLLFKAINENNIESARVAVGQGANINAENLLGSRPVDLAVDLGHFDLAHFLLAANRGTEKQEEAIPLPPPMVSRTAQGNARRGLPPILSGPQVSLPEVSLEALPVISAPQFLAPRIPKVRISAPTFAAPKISAPQFRSPILPISPPRKKNLAIDKALPVPSKLSEMPSANPGSISDLEIISPPEPPPLTTEDGTLIQIPAPLQSTKTKIIIALPLAQATAFNGSKPKDNGFMSNVWNSMTGWMPFVGNDNEDNIPPNKRSGPAALEHPNFAPAPKKWLAPLSTNIKDQSNKAERSLASNVWNSMTDWSPSSDDLKKK